MKRKWTVKTTTRRSPFGTINPPVDTYNGRYYTRWFMANGVARRIPVAMGTGYDTTSEVVEITPEIEDLIDK